MRTATTTVLLTGLFIARTAAAEAPLKVALFDEVGGRCRWYVQNVGTDGRARGKETIATFDSPCRWAHAKIAPNRRQALVDIGFGSDEAVQYRIFLVDLVRGTHRDMPLPAFCPRPGGYTTQYSAGGEVLALCTAQAAPAQPNARPLFVHEYTPYVVDDTSPQAFALAGSFTNGNWKLVEVKKTKTTGGCGSAVGVTVLDAYVNRSRVDNTQPQPLRAASAEELQQLATLPLSDDGEWRVARTSSGAVAAWWEHDDGDGMPTTPLVDVAGHWLPLVGLDKRYPAQISLDGRFLLLDYSEDWSFGPLIYDVVDRRLVWRRGEAEPVDGGALWWPPKRE